MNFFQGKIHVFRVDLIHILPSAESLFCLLSGHPCQLLHLIANEVLEKKM